MQQHISEHAWSLSLGQLEKVWLDILKPEGKNIYTNYKNKDTCWLRLTTPT